MEIPRIRASRVCWMLLMFRWLPCVIGDEGFVQIIVKRPINVVSDRYISFAIDPVTLMDIRTKSGNVKTIASTFGPAYLKIAETSTKLLQLEDDPNATQPAQPRIKPSDWMAINNWIRAVNFEPIITLPYKENEWKPRSAMRILGISDKMGVKNCGWQLGSGFNITDAINYVDDLTTLRTILDAFGRNNWSLIGLDLSENSQPDEAKLYTELSQHIVEANGWIQSSDDTSVEQNENHTFEQNAILRGLQKGRTPLWLNVPVTHTATTSNMCTESCIANGLQWAQTIGEAAQKGFKVVFKSITGNDFSTPTLSYYITLIHKKVIGDKVFDTKIVNGDRSLSRFYAHCSRNVSGAFTVMGINFAETKTKLSTKLPNKYTGPEVMQYILTVDKLGMVHINTEPVNEGSTIEPVMKVKRPNRPTSFSLPPRSVGFWIFPSANLKECIDFKEFSAEVEQPIEVADRPRTASEVLLQELILESVGNEKDKANIRSKRHAIVKKDEESSSRRKRDVHSDRDKRSIFNKRTTRSENMLELMNTGKREQKRRNNAIPLKVARNALFSSNPRRSKRQITNELSKIFEKFDFSKAKMMNVPPLFNMARNRGPAAIPPVVSTVHDVYRIDSDEKLFKSSENKELPKGDVFFEVGDDEAPNQDYVAFDEADDKVGGNINTDPARDHVPNQFVEFYTDIEENKPPTKQAAIPTMGELWEADIYQKPVAPRISNSYTVNDPPYISDPSASIQTVVQEMQPTWEQNQVNLRKAKESLQGFYIQDIPEQRTLLHAPKRESIEDNFFMTRRRRSVDSKLNDEIENKIVEIEVNNTLQEMINFNNADDAQKKLNKMNLLDKISKIVSSIEKIDNIGDLTLLDKLNDEIKEIEDFLVEKSHKIKLFKPKVIAKPMAANNDDLPRKCKILALNLEQQCLNDGAIFPKMVTKRDTRINGEGKGQNKKSSGILKHLFKDKANGGRRRRAASVSWEADDDDGHRRTNMIAKEYDIETADTNPNNVVPSMVLTKTIILQDGDVVSNNAELFVDHPEQPDHLQETYIDQNGVMHPVAMADGNEENGKNDTNTTQYEAPKFMRTFTKSVESLMDVVNRHVSGWWHMMS